MKMCEVCLHNPCLPRCPNHKELKPIGECAYCGDLLSPDYEVIEDNEGNIFCGKYCALMYHGIKEKEYEE
jgi:hypothetical protein